MRLDLLNFGIHRKTILKSEMEQNTHKAYFKIKSYYIKEIF